MKENKILIAPSILSGDFGCLADEAKKIEQAGADYIHVDIMDGQFVQNITFGPKALSAINRATPLFLDVHAMIYNPYGYVERFVESGADRLTFHFEATEQVEETIDYIHRCNILAGLAFCPETSVEFVIKYLSLADMILLMTVNPGFGGQAFIREVIEKIRFVRDACNKLGIVEGGKVVAKDEMHKFNPYLIEVDGGINDQTGKQCVEAGANVLVSGNYLYKEAKTMKEGIEILRGTN